MFKEIKKIKKLISKSKNILLISHRKPDPDTLGAALAMHIYLNNINKKTKLVCIDRPSKNYNFIPKISKFKNNFILKEHDLIFIMDAGDHKMTGFHLEHKNLFSKKIPIINIDHHASNDNYGTINVVDTSAASTTVIITEILNEINAEITPQIATCLMSGLYSDTGSFMHSNTDERALKIASILSKKGADIEIIKNKIFSGKNIKTLQLWGKILENTTLSKTGIALSILQEENSNIEKTENYSGVIDYINTIEGSKMAVLLKIDKEGNIKGSLRTESDKINLSKIANKFGGGGHKKAAGFFIKKNN